VTEQPAGAMSKERARALHGLEARIGHRFSDLRLLERALTHTSRANEAGSQVRHNEPLEFLGDAVLGFAIADLLHRRDPERDEGAKSRTRALLVSEPSLARRSDALGLPALLLLGRGEEKTGGRGKTTLWADAYEALIAALYLDGGIAIAHGFVEREFGEELASGADMASLDHKSALQELLQARGDPVPDYEVAGEAGPSHRRRFHVVCRVKGEALASGEGPSKKEAQQEAARKALAVLRLTR
jgi:ribonuclease-3